MTGDPEFDERLCRLNGKQPNARDRWRAFHRLWRIAHGHGAFQDIEAGICFRVMFRDWRAVRLMESEKSDGYVNNSRVPKFLRERLLRHRIRKRLHGNHLEWDERDRKVARTLREQQGIEVTPIEVAEVRRKVINIARAKAAELGLEMPADDAELLQMLKLGASRDEQ